MAVVLYNGSAIELTNEEAKWQVGSNGSFIPNLNSNTFIVISTNERVSIWL